MTNIFVYQIYYNDESKAALDLGFIPLDNSRNERPDWREYHPIRKFLLSTKLEHDAYYGFLSSRFQSKTGLSAAQVKTFIKYNDGADVILFSPHFDKCALNINIFQQGEMHHQSLMQESANFFKLIGLDVDIRTLVNDLTNTIFANYFVAKPTFWRDWFKLTEQLYDLCELASSKSLGLLAATPYNDTMDLQLKVFLIERLATFLLSTETRYKTATYDPTLFPMPPALGAFLHQMLMCDALKIAYRRHGNAKYMYEFLALRDHVISKIIEGRQPPPGTTT